jgi:hypothetical protein
MREIFIKSAVIPDCEHTIFSPKAAVFLDYVVEIREELLNSEDIVSSEYKSKF